MIVKLEDHLWLRNEILEKVSAATETVVRSFFITKMGMEGGVTKAVQKAAEEALRPYGIMSSWNRENLAKYLSAHVDVTINFLPESEMDFVRPWSGCIFVYMNRMTKLLQKSGLFANADDARALGEILKRGVREVVDVSH
jgi:hypothetical protein